jgi:plasmid maintenance system antidote protein VapI
VQARRLQREGLTTERIASIFGVSRQRISALLRETETN